MLVTLTVDGRAQAAPLLRLLVGGLDEAVARNGDPAEADLAESLGVITSALRTKTTTKRGRTGRMQARPT